MSGPADTHLDTLMTERSIRLGLTATDRFDAVRQCGAALVETGAVGDGYIDSMLEREHAVSTYIGEGVSLPHGTSAGKDAVTEPAMVVLGFPDGVPWDDGHLAFVCIGIAAPAGGHVALVARLADILLDPALAEELRTATDAAAVRALFGGTTPVRHREPR